MVRVVLVDHQELVRRGVSVVLSTEGTVEVVGEFASAEEALARIPDLQPDLVLMDLRMPDLPGLQATAVLREQCPAANVLILTASEDVNDLGEALRAGARGYVLKGASPDDLIQAVHQTAQGWMVVSPEMADKLTVAFPWEPVFRNGGNGMALEALSSREWDVLRLLSDGMSNRQIADRLVVSENTVKTHMRSILSKLHLKNRAQAAAYARQSERDGPVWAR